MTTPLPHITGNYSSRNGILDDLAFFQPPVDNLIEIPEHSGQPPLRVFVSRLRSTAVLRCLTIDQLQLIWNSNTTAARPKISTAKSSKCQPTVEQRFITKMQQHFNGWSIPEIINIGSSSARSAAQKWEFYSMFPDGSTVVDHKNLPLGFQWGEDSCPRAVTCDHPGCRTPDREDVPAVLLTCGHSYHRVCCLNFGTRRTNTGHSAVGLGCERTESLMDDDSQNMYCIICTEALPFAVRIYGLKAKSLVESPPTENLDDDESEEAEVEDDDTIQKWTPRKCQEAVQRANLMLRSLCDAIPPSHCRLEE